MTDKERESSRHFSKKQLATLLALAGAGSGIALEWLLKSKEAEPLRRRIIEAGKEAKDVLLRLGTIPPLAKDVDELRSVIFTVERNSAKRGVSRRMVGELELWSEKMNWQPSNEIPLLVAPGLDEHGVGKVLPGVLLSEETIVPLIGQLHMEEKGSFELRPRELTTYGLVRVGDVIPGALVDHHTHPRILDTMIADCFAFVVLARKLCSTTPDEDGELISYGDFVENPGG